MERFRQWKEFSFRFLTSCRLNDFTTNLNACRLKKWEKKQLIGRLLNYSKVLG